MLRKPCPSPSTTRSLVCSGRWVTSTRRGPHWYLPLMGVDLPYIGCGLGSALLRHAVARADKDGAPCYLEATGSLNRRLYGRHGFEEIGEIQFGSSPTMWPMLREPR